MCNDIEEIMNLEDISRELYNITNDIYIIYIPDRILDVNNLLEEYEDVLLDDETILHQSDYKPILTIVKKEFNPLLKEQSVLVLAKNLEVILKIPIVLLNRQNHLLTIKEFMSDLSIDLTADNKFILNLMVKYMITKNLTVLNTIYNKKESMRIINCQLQLAFKKLKSFFDADKINDKLLFDIINIFDGSYRNMVQENHYNFKKIYENKDNDIQRKIDRIRNNVDDNAMQKNLIVFHMESISNEIFNNHIAEFSFTKELMNKSMNIGKFFSSATSSAMAITDFLYGNDFEMDEFTDFHSMQVSGRYGKNLYQILNDKGYLTLGIGYNYFPSTEEVNSHNIWGIKGNDYQWEPGFDIFIDKVLEFIKKNKNKKFAMHIWNLLPHVGQRCEQTEECSNFTERINEAYQSLDLTIKCVMEELDKNKLIDNTVIAGYGDHGDDKWTRSMNAGFTHTIEPYHNIINTPSFIYDNRMKPFYYDQVVSLVDLKYSLLYLTGNEVESRSEIMGINIFKNTNKYVYSKRLFANQRRMETIQSPAMLKLHNFSENEYRNPAYAIVSTSYTLLVSNYGCEMFMNQLDPCSYNNILRFYEMDENGNIVRFNNRGAWRGHFRTIMMTDEQLYDVMDNFNTMRKLLTDRIAKHENLVGEKLVNKFDGKNFNKIKDMEFVED